MADHRYPIEEIARCGNEIYDRIRGKVEGKCDGKVVAIDVDTGDYAISDAGWSAADTVRAKNSDAEIWLVRVGQRSFVKLGWRGMGIRDRLDRQLKMNHVHDRSGN